MHERECARLEMCQATDRRPHSGIQTGIIEQILCDNRRSDDIAVSQRGVVAKLGEGGMARLDVTTRDQEYSWRVPHGIWSEWRKPDATGHLDVYHPRLILDGRQLIEVRTRDALHAPSRPVSVELVRSR